jgi:hypothetical protein
MVWMIVSGIIVLVAATFGGRPYGRALQSRPYWWFLGANAFVILIATAFVFIASTPDAFTASTSGVLYGVALGIGFGGPSGLRLGYKGLLVADAGKDRA